MPEQVKNLSVIVATQKFVFDVSSDMLVSTLKDMVSAKAGTTVARLRHKDLNLDMEDRHPLSEYEISDNDTLMGIVPTNGGSSDGRQTMMTKSDKEMINKELKDAKTYVR